MSLPRFWSVLRRLACLALIAACVLPVLPSRPACAADFDKLDGSIKEIPADAAFYYAFLRNREQIEAVTSSKAWAKLWALPAVQKAWQDAQKEPGSPVEKYHEWLKNAENKQLHDVAVDMLSHEVFIYGGSNVTDVFDLYSRVMNAAWTEGLRAGFEQAMTGQKKDPPISDDQATRIMLSELARNLKALQVPDVIVGFKVSDPRRAAAQVKRLEKLIQQEIDKSPDFKGQLKWAKVAGNDFLTLTLDNKGTPFDEDSIRKHEQKPGQYEALIKRMKEIKATISLGVRGKYVLLAVGESTAPLARLGKGKLLVDQPELKPLAPFADRRLTAISYVSKTYRARAEFSYFNLRKWVEIAEETLPKATLPAELKARIQKDLATLSKELKAAEPKPGAELGFGFLTPRGKESYAFDWSEQPGVDGSKPLTILDHVGGDPLLMWAGRSKYAPEAWPRLVGRLKVLHGYYEDFGMPQLDPEQKKGYQEFMRLARPLLARFDEATGKMFLPALADGQWAVVVDAELSSKQWAASLPPTEKPVTLPEPALVYGVSDAALLQKALGEYRALLNDTFSAAQKASPGVPPLVVPPPETRKVKGGALFYYPLPAEWGLDKKLLPNAGLSDKIAVLTIAPEHSERLLTATPLKITGGPLANVKRPLAGASHINAAGLVDLMTGWSDTAGQFVPDKQVGEAVEQARTITQLLKVFRGYSSVSYLESGALVTHAEMHLEDLK